MADFLPGLFPQYCNNFSCQSFEKYLSLLSLLLLVSIFVTCTVCLTVNESFLGLQAWHLMSYYKHSQQQWIWYTICASTYWYKYFLCRKWKLVVATGCVSSMRYNNPIEWCWQDNSDVSLWQDGRDVARRWSSSQPRLSRQLLAGLEVQSLGIKGLLRNHQLS